LGELGESRVKGTPRGGRVWKTFRDKDDRAKKGGSWYKGQKLLYGVDHLGGPGNSPSPPQLSTDTNSLRRTLRLSVQGLCVLPNRKRSKNEAVPENQILTKKKGVFPEQRRYTGLRAEDHEDDDIRGKKVRKGFNSQKWEGRGGARFSGWKLEKKQEKKKKTGGTKNYLGPRGHWNQLSKFKIFKAHLNPIKTLLGQGGGIGGQGGITADLKKEGGWARAIKQR